VFETKPKIQDIGTPPFKNAAALTSLDEPDFKFHGQNSDKA
jgi:hypothetical protein